MESTKTKTFGEIDSAEVVLLCSDLGPTLRFFTEDLGFALASLSPADDPAIAVVVGYGLRLRLERAESFNSSDNKHIRLRLYVASASKDLGDGDSPLTAPNGVQIELVIRDQPLNIPELKPTFVLNKFRDQADWVEGRAGMRYRDLIPDRLGGRFIASHIQIPTAGPVPDYVHFHRIRFQMIYCYKGWARLVYEDQGKPFLFYAGDCVLQPPEIRHRVLESSAGLEVIEIACPADHETFADHDLTLPTDLFNPDRDFQGQRFVRHIPSESGVEKWRLPGFECIDSRIGNATNGLAGVRTIRPADPKSDWELTRHTAEFVFFFILAGSVDLRRADNVTDTLAPGDTLVIPSDLEYAFSDCSDDLEMLEVTLPEIVAGRN